MPASIGTPHRSSIRDAESGSLTSRCTAWLPNLRSPTVEIEPPDSYDSRARGEEAVPLIRKIRTGTVLTLAALLSLVPAGCAKRPNVGTQNGGVPLVGFPETPPPPHMPGKPGQLGMRGRYNTGR